MKVARGFTLIELMIVIAIIAILAAIALPTYQNYLIRAQVTEGITLASGAKRAMAVYYSQVGQLPGSNQSAGLAAPASISGQYVQSVTVDTAGKIKVLFGHEANDKLFGQTLTIDVSDANGGMTWQCSGIDDRYLPSSCRS